MKPGAAPRWRRTASWRGDIGFDALLRLPQLLRLPPHRHQDAVATAGMVEEDPLLQRTGGELAVFAELQRDLGEAVRLTGGVEAEDVRLRLGRADEGVVERCEHEEEDREHRHEQRQAGRVAHPAKAPALPPARHDPLET